MVSSCPSRRPETVPDELYFRDAGSVAQNVGCCAVVINRATFIATNRCLVHRQTEAQVHRGGFMTHLINAVKRVAGVTQLSRC